MCFYQDILRLALVVVLTGISNSQRVFGQHFKCRIPEQTGADADATQVGRSKAVDNRVRSILDVITLLGRITVRHCRLLIKHWLNKNTVLFRIESIIL